MTVGRSPLAVDHACQLFDAPEMGVAASVSLAAIPTIYSRLGEPFVNRSETLEWFLLGYDHEIECNGRGRSTTIGQLLNDAIRKYEKSRTEGKCCADPLSTLALPETGPQL